MQVATLNSAIDQAPGFDIPDPLDIPSVKNTVSPQEWEARCNLAATYRLCAMYGWDDFIFTHISYKLPDRNGKKRFLMNPYGVAFDEMTASALLVVDADGEVVQDSPYFANPAGFTIHSAVHLARPDAHCVLHLHSMYGVAVSAQQDGLLPCTQFAMVVGDDVAYHDYEGIATDLDERERIVSDLGDKHLLMLKNHGTLTVGENCPIAFLRMYFLEKACMAQILAQADNKPLSLCEPELASKVNQQGSAGFKAGIGDNLAWPAFLRKLRRHNPGWDQ